MKTKQEIVEFLQTNTTNTFYKSLLTRWEDKGFLSERQMECVERAMIKLEKPAPRLFSIAIGQTFEIKTWLAKALQKQLELNFFLRNLEVVEVISETPKAYMVRVKFVSKIACNCHVCGRPLDNAISKATGIGPICAVKIGLTRPSLSNAQATIDELEALCVQIGTLPAVWVPKSQIKRTDSQA